MQFNSPGLAQGNPQFGVISGQYNDPRDTIRLTPVVLTVNRDASICVCAAIRARGAEARSITTPRELISRGRNSPTSQKIPDRNHGWRRGFAGL